MAPAHLILLQQALAVIFYVEQEPQGWEVENAQSLLAIIIVSHPENQGTLHVKAAENG